jgi:hypothetical protein
MSRKKMIMIGMVLGSVAGGYLPSLLGAGSRLFLSVITSGIGGVLGIWIAMKFTA